MFKRILVPTDGTELSLKAVAGAAALAKSFGAELIGVTVVEPYSFATVSEYTPAETSDAYEGRMGQIAAERLRKFADAARGAGVTAKTSTVRSFSPYEAIIETAKKSDCDLIVMASHGRRGLTGVLLGSETQKVLTHSTVPVLVYR
jgi:nucleotide-binding universal stress UspA family protein